MINITRSLKKTSTAGLLAAACVLPFCSPVFAGGVDEPWMLDDLKAQLESLNNRVGKLERTYVQKGTELLWARLSGHVNRAALWAGNGHDRDFFNVDNDAGTSTRFRLEAGKDFNQDVSVGTVIEVNASPNPIDTITFKRRAGDSDSGNFGLKGRKADLFFASKTYGKVSLGKNFTASALTGSADLSGTDSTVLHSDPGSFGGGLKFQKSIGGVATRLFKVGDAFSAFDTGRRDRLQYDSPAFYGFTFSAAAMDGTGFRKDGDWDLALRYAQEINKIKLAAAMGYARLERDTVAAVPATLTAGGLPLTDATAGRNKNDRGWAGSASILFPQGWNFTVAGSKAHENHKDKVTGVRSDRGSYNSWYGKVGYLFNWCQWGQTALGVDYGHTRNYLNGSLTSEPANGSVGTSFSYTGPSKARAIGAGVVQNIDAIATELYAGYHNFRVTGLTNVLGENINPNNINVGMVGARIKM